MRLVYAGTDGDLHAWCPGDAPARRITWSWDEVGPEGTRTRLSYGWPACSPDGARVLALVRRGEHRHFVYAVDLSGITAQELVDLGAAVPIYANWSPDGAYVAVLVQRERTLALELLGAATPSGPRTLVRGAPLFWSWAPDGRTLVVHVGASPEDVSAGGTFLVDAASGAMRETLSAVPAMFRAPSWSSDGRLVAFARATERGTRLILCDPATGERQSRELAQGPVAFLWHPRLPVLAWAIASDEAPHVYREVVVLDLRAGRERASACSALAFYWHPTELCLFRITVDQRRQELAWEAMAGDGGAEVLARFLPTREAIFAASFFDQYASSHAPVAPDGGALAVSGRLLEDAGARGPRIYRVATTGSTPARLIGEGVCPVWGS